MTGTGFDGLVVNHGGLDEVTQHLHRMVSDIDQRMRDLERDLAALSSDWSGAAQTAYASAKATWDAAIAEMARLLDQTGSTVDRSNAEYRAADLRGARQFDIG